MSHPSDQNPPLLHAFVREVSIVALETAGEDVRLIVEVLSSASDWLVVVAIRSYYLIGDAQHVASS